MRKNSAQFFFTFCRQIGQTFRVGNTPSTGLTPPRGVARSNTAAASRAGRPVNLKRPIASPRSMRVTSERERQSEHHGEANAACRQARNMVNCTFKGTGWPTSRRHTRSR